MISSALWTRLRTLETQGERRTLHVTPMVNVAVAVAVVAPVSMSAERRAGGSRRRAHYAADDRSDWAADHSAGNRAARRAYGLRRGGAGAERKTSQRDKSDFVHTVIPPSTHYH